MESKKERRILVEQLTHIHSATAEFSTSTDAYSKCMNRLLIFSKNNELRVIKILYLLLSSFPNLKRHVKRQTFNDFINDYKVNLGSSGIEIDFDSIDLDKNEQKVIDLFRDMNIERKVRIVEFVNSNLCTTTQKSDIPKSRILIELIQQVKSSFNSSTYSLDDSEYGISEDEFSDALEALDYEKRILLFRSIQALGNGLISNEVVNFFRNKIINSISSLMKLEKDKISHCQLFASPPGCGSLPMALAYARKIITNNSPFPESCNKMLANLTHPDLHFIYPVINTSEFKSKAVSSNFLPTWRDFINTSPYGGIYDWYSFAGFENKQGKIGVDEAENLVKKMSLKSFKGGWKCAIIWMAETINVSATNKLLKLIEEPPEKTLFIFVAENQELMLYRDKAHQCFTFENKEVPCPKNPLDISKIPVQG